MADVLVIGAGITGLSCAWTLRKLGVDAVVLESSDRAGGMIRTARMDGYLIEWGPNSILPTAETMDFLDEVGLSSELAKADPRAPRYIYIDGRLRKAPFGAITAGGLLRMLAEPFIRSRSPSGESVADFFRRRVGSEAHDRLVAPVVTGIYAGDTQQLSAEASFPRLVELERKYGSITLGMLRSRSRTGKRKPRSRISTFPSGLERLPNRLAEDLNVEFGVAKSRLADAKAVVITVPAYRAVAALEGDAPALARLLESVRYAPMVVAASSVADDSFREPLRGFGFLVPRTERIHLLGTLFSSALFPGRAPRGRQLLTSFIGGTFQAGAVEWSDERLWDTVCGELKRVLQVSSSPEPVTIVRHPRALPQYVIGHERWVAAVREELKRTPGLFLAGNYLDGVSVPACIEQGRRTARAAAEYLRRKP